MKDRTLTLDQLRQMLADVHERYPDLPDVETGRARFDGDLLITPSAESDTPTEDLESVEAALSESGWRVFYDEDAPELTAHPQDDLEAVAAACRALRYLGDKDWTPYSPLMAVWNRSGSVIRAGLWAQASDRDGYDVRVSYHLRDASTMVGNPERLDHAEQLVAEAQSLGFALGRLTADGWQVSLRQNRVGDRRYLIAKLPAKES